MQLPSNNMTIVNYQKGRISFRITSLPTRIKRPPSCTIRKTDGRTDKTKLIFDFRNFVNAPKNVAWYAAYITRMSCYWELGEKGTV